MDPMKNTIMCMAYQTVAWVITMALATFFGLIFIWTTLNPEICNRKSIPDIKHFEIGTYRQLVESP